MTKNLHNYYPSIDISNVVYDDIKSQSKPNKSSVKKSNTKNVTRSTKVIFSEKKNSMSFVSDDDNLDDAEPRESYSNAKYFFTADSNGNLRQLSIKDKSIEFEYICIHLYPIYSIKMSSDSKFLFTSDNKGQLKQFSLLKENSYKLKLLQNFGNVHNSEIRSIAVTSDTKYLFTSDRLGNLKQWNIKTCSLKKDFGEIHKGMINCITITENDDY